MKENINTSKETLKMSAKATSSLDKIAVCGACFAGWGFISSFILFILIILMKLEGVIVYMKIMDSLLQISIICFLGIPSYFLLLFFRGTKKAIKTKDSTKLKEYIPFLSIAFKTFFITFFVLTSVLLVIILIDFLR
ncbi:MAG: hypothetical protein LBE13_05525 [Bacteroidales bacterium]|jgi:hypothetical protein|nr:hypothetical protein [Bacteroidales bacterium]